ncbi:BTB/POZ protein [Helicostylum pulchrum]|nr:BTB/POZ protein [Helicostylum pulchrum]
MEHYIVKLDVGGTVYRTTKDTLRESEFLCNLVDGNWSENLSNQKEIFIDRDGFLFRYVLLYLRTGQLDVDKQYWKSLRNEAEFYIISNLATMVNTMIDEEQLKKPVFRLLTQEEFITYSNINVTGFRRGLCDRTAVGPGKEFITSIRCDVTSYNCPREIPVHKESRHCGRACNKAKGDNYVGYSSKETIMYLVSNTE